MNYGVATADGGMLAHKGERMPKCAACGKNVDVTMTFSASGPGVPKREPTPPICSPCFRKRTKAIINNLKGKPNA